MNKDIEAILYKLNEVFQIVTAMREDSDYMQ